MIHDSGISGDTVVAAGGEGSRNIRPTGDPSVSHPYSNIKIQELIASKETALKITDQVVEKFFDNFSGITNISTLEALREHKF